MAHAGLLRTFPQGFLNPFLAQVPQDLSRPSSGGRTPTGQGFSPSHWPLCAADRLRNQHFVLFFVSRRGRDTKSRSPGRRPPRRNGGTFRFLLVTKGRTLRQASVRQATRARPTPPPLRGTSPYTGEAWRKKVRHLPLHRGGFPGAARISFLTGRKHTPPWRLRCGSWSDFPRCAVQSRARRSGPGPTSARWS